MPGGKAPSGVAAFSSGAGPKAAQSRFPERPLVALALMTACWLALPWPVQAGRQVLKGHVPRITKGLTSVGRLDGGAPLDLAIGLPLRNRQQLTNLLDELYEPSNPNFRHYLTADQFASGFGPSQEDYQAVIDFAKAHGLVVKRTHPNRALLDVRGSVADIEKAFHVNLRLYQHPAEARQFFAPDAEPSLELETPVLAISGLDSFVKPRPRIHVAGAWAQPAVRPLRGGGGGGSGGGGSGADGSYYGYDFLAAYAAGVSQTGAGQSLGLFELTGYDPDDINDYLGETGLPGVPLQNILIDGFDGDDSNVDYAVEATCDIEMAISMAPELSSVLVYEGPTPLDEAPLETNYIQPPITTAQINDVLNQMATDDAANQLSCSYQMDINTSTVQIFQQYAAQGQSFFQASGDSGAYAGAIDEPSDDPYITVVGGTTLSTTGPEGSWVSETVWLTPASYDPFVGYIPEEASGGGVSLVYPMPAWQQGISMTANQGSTTMRNMPDAALIADNVDVVFGNDYFGFSFDFTVSGTSLAAPLWAGFMALVNEQAAANNQAPVGFANPALYAIGKSTNYSACFHDITTGNNFTAESPSKYAATTGYDLCSGWGTMIGGNLMQALLSPPSESLLVTPPLGFTSSGVGGGPFTVTSQTFTLTNIGAEQLRWSLINTTAWLTVSGTPGVLRPGRLPATVTVSLNSSASNFLIGNYSGNVTFVNLTDGTSQNRQFDLYVGNGGFETGDFTDWTMVGSADEVFVLSADDADVGGTNALYGAADAQFVHSGLYGAYLGATATDGSLSQIIATTAGQRYVLSFWLTSIPYEGSTTPNDFAAKWNDLTVYAETNLGVFGWTNLQFAVKGAPGESMVEFDFKNVPAAFGLDDVRVEPVPAPVLQSFAVTGGVFTLTWSGVPGLSYQVQATSDLGNSAWTNVLAPITASGEVVSASGPVATASQTLYRVVLLPGY